MSSKTFFSESSILTVRFLGENQIQDFLIQNWIFRFFGQIQKRIMNPIKSTFFVDSSNQIENRILKKVASGFPIKNGT